MISCFGTFASFSSEDIIMRNHKNLLLLGEKIDDIEKADAFVLEFGHAILLAFSHSYIGILMPFGFLSCSFI